MNMTRSRCGPVARRLGLGLPSRPNPSPDPSQVGASELKRTLFMQTLDALRSQLPPPAADKPDALQLWSSTLRQTLTLTLTL